jgi:hypothetical protein
MEWQEIRERYPHQWIVVEATGTKSENERLILGELGVFGTYPDGVEAIKARAQWQRRYPTREFYFLHTDRVTPDIRDTGGIRLGPVP